MENLLHWRGLPKAFDGRDWPFLREGHGETAGQRRQLPFIRIWQENWRVVVVLDNGSGRGTERARARARARASSSTRRVVLTDLQIGLTVAHNWEDEDRQRRAACSESKTKN